MSSVYTMGFNITELKARYTIDLALALGSCTGSDFIFSLLELLVLFVFSFFEGISFSCRLTLQLDHALNILQFTTTTQFYCVS
jgi:hypothetical protein